MLSIRRGFLRGLTAAMGAMVLTAVMLNWLWPIDRTDPGFELVRSTETRDVSETARICFMGGCPDDRHARTFCLMDGLGGADRVAACERHVLRFDLLISNPRMAASATDHDGSGPR
jgi:hypothetical protein